MKEHRRKVTIYLKSGARVRLRVYSFELEKRPGGDVYSLTWSGRWWTNRVLGTIIVSEIAAVVYSRW